MACKSTKFETGFTFERLEALEAAIAEGVLVVKYSDKEITYKSTAEMLQARDLARRVLGLKKRCGGKGLFGGTRLTGKHSKGLDRG